MKKVGSCWYMHKSNLKDLCTLPYPGVLMAAINHFYANFSDGRFDVIKYDSKKRAFSLIEAIDWDELFEPIVGTSYFYPFGFNESPYAPESVRVIPGGKMVYHQKHLFVDNSYNHFNIEQSIQRTKLLENITQVKQNKSKIGSLRYWRGILDLYGLPYYM